MTFAENMDESINHRSAVASADASRALGKSESAAGATVAPALTTSQGGSMMDLDAMARMEGEMVSFREMMEQMSAGFQGRKRRCYNCNSDKHLVAKCTKAKKDKEAKK